MSRKCDFLVTGGAGFIGSHLVIRLLRMGNRVRVLDNFSTGKRENIEFIRQDIARNQLEQGAFELIDGDIRDLEACKNACKGVEGVFHQAALGSVPRSIEDPLTTHEVNVDGTLNILTGARAAGVRRVIYASSSSVYGNTKILPQKEGHEATPLSPYAISKKSDELYANCFQLNYGLEVIGLRYFNVFGPRQDPDSPYAAAIPIFIMKQLRDEAPVINGDGTITRDFTFVENVIDANLLAFTAGKEATGKSYNIALGKTCTLNALCALISRILSKQINPIHGPPRKGDIQASLADISLAQEYLRYQGSHSLEEGMKQTVEWYQTGRVALK